MDVQVCLTDASATVSAPTSKWIRRIRRRPAWSIKRASATEQIWRVGGCPTRAVECASTPERIRRVRGGSTWTIECSPSPKRVGCVRGRSARSGIRASSAERVGRVCRRAAGSVECSAATEWVGGVSGLSECRAGDAQQQGGESFHGCPFLWVWTFLLCRPSQAHWLSPTSITIGHLPFTVMELAPMPEQISHVYLTVAF